MKTILTQQISNHPLFPNIKREVEVSNIAIQASFSQIVIDADIRYYDENQEGKEVTSAFQSKIPNWIINNADTTTVRDAEGQPITNPNFVEAPTEGEDTRTDEQKEPYMKAPSFDYFFGIITAKEAPNLVELLRTHIVLNDQVKFFDNLLNIG